MNVSYINFKPKEALPTNLRDSSLSYQKIYKAALLRLQPNSVLLQCCPTTAPQVA